MSFQAIFWIAWKNNIQLILLILSNINSWNNYCIVGLEFEILREVIAFGDIFVIDTEDLILAGFMPQEDYFLF